MNPRDMVNPTGRRPRRSPGERIRRRRRVVVWQKRPQGWLAVAGDIGGRTARVLHAATLPGTPGHAGLPAGLREGRDVESVLVIGSRRCVFRTFECPSGAEDAELERIVQLRLEAELPYGLGEAEWGWQLQRGTDSATAIVVAVPAAEVAEAERELERAGRRCEVVEAREAALAALARCLAPDARTVAVLAVEADAVVLAVVHKAKMAYARSLSAVPTADGTALAEVSAEVEQTLQHVAYERGLSGLEALFVVGEGQLAARLAERLCESPGLPVRPAVGATGVEVAAEAGSQAEVLGRYASCIGALVAAHERGSGRESTGPVVRVRRPARRGKAAMSAARLVAVNALLLVALIASAFVVRGARLRAATQALAAAQPLLAEVGPLEEEVRILEAESQRQRAKLDLVLAIVAALPDKTEVSELRIDRKGNVSIRGTTPSVEAVSKAVAALQETEGFENPQFGRVEPGKQGSTFQINCTLR